MQNNSVQSDTRRFWEAQADQSQSLLLSLPGELRNKILLSLFKKGSDLPNLESIGMHSQDESDSRTRDLLQEAFGLSAQLLSTCQQIYAEGIGILYTENVVTMTHIRSPSLHERDFSTLQFLNYRAEIPIMQTALHSEMKTEITEYFSSPDTIDTLLVIRPDYFTYVDLDYHNSIAEICLTLQRFQRFKITDNSLVGHQTLGMCQFLATILFQKDVELLFSIVPTEDFIDTIGDLWTSARIRALQRLRCRTISVQHKWRLPARLRTLQADVKRIVESLHPAENLTIAYEQMQHLMRRVVSCVETQPQAPQIPASSLAFQHSWDMKVLADMVMGSNSNGFKQQKEFMLHNASLVVQSWLDLNIRALELRAARPFRPLEQDVADDEIQRFRNIAEKCLEDLAKHAEST